MGTRDYLFGVALGAMAMGISCWMHWPTVQAPCMTQRDIAACEDICKPHSGIHALEFVEGHTPICVCNNSARFYQGVVTNP